MATKFDVVFSIKLAFYYVLARFAFLHQLLARSTRDKLPIDWSFHMFWLAFRTGGTRIYNDYPSEIKDPVSFEPKVKADPPYRLDAREIESFYKKGYIGPFDLMTPEEATSLKNYLTGTILTTKSTTWQ